MEPAVIKKAHHFLSIIYGDVQFLDIMNFLGGATSLDSFHKAYNTSKKWRLLCLWMVWRSTKDEEQWPSPIGLIFQKTLKREPSRKDYSDYQKLLSCGLKTEKALSKMKFSKQPFQEEKTTKFCLIFGLMRIWAHLKPFYAGTTTETLAQHSKQCKNCLLLITWKELTCWRSGVHFRILRIFVSTNLP